MERPNVSGKLRRLPRPVRGERGVRRVSGRGAYDGPDADVAIPRVRGRDRGAELGRIISSR